MWVLLSNEAVKQIMARVYLSIGSNINPRHYIRTGVADLQVHYGKLILSSVYESEAVGFEGDNFYNLVAGFDTNLDVYIVANTLRMIEADNDRQRSDSSFSARSLDLDILLYDDLILKEKNVKIPRDDILKYAFVLLPLAEIAPQLKHPVTGETMADLWQAFAAQKTQKKQSLWQVDFDFYL